MSSSNRSYSDYGVVHCSTPDDVIISGPTSTLDLYLLVEVCGFERRLSLKMGFGKRTMNACDHIDSTACFAKPGQNISYGIGRFYALIHRAHCISGYHHSPPCFHKIHLPIIIA